MTDLPKCKGCNGDNTYHVCGMVCVDMPCDHEKCPPNALMSTDADRLDAGRKVMEAAIDTTDADGALSSNQKRRLTDALRDLDLPTILGIKGETE